MKSTKKAENFYFSATKQHAPELNPVLPTSLRHTMTLLIKSNRSRIVNKWPSQFAFPALA
jgi:hypothetical protein